MGEGREECLDIKEGFIPKWLHICSVLHQFNTASNVLELFIFTRLLTVKFISPDFCCQLFLVPYFCLHIVKAMIALNFT